MLFTNRRVTARLPRVKSQVLDNAFPEISVTPSSASVALTVMTVAKIQINAKITKQNLYFLSDKPLQRRKNKEIRL